MAEKVMPYVGQIWRRKKDAKLIQIIAVHPWYSEYDCHWKGVDYEGRGAIWRYNLVDKYEAVETP